MKAFLIGLLFASSAFAAPTCFETALRQKGNAYLASQMVVKLSNNLNESKVKAQISLVKNGTVLQTKNIKCKVEASLAHCNSGDGRVIFTVKAKGPSVVSLQADEILIMETYTAKDGDVMFDETSAFGKKININQMKVTNCNV